MTTTRDLPRERLVALGAAALSDAELVAIHLGTGSQGRDMLELARSLLRQYGGVGGLAHAEVDQLAQAPGIGPAKACRLVAAFALADRISPAEGQVVGSSADIGAIAIAQIGRCRTEEVLLLVMDGAHRVRRTVRVARGGATGCPLPVREIVALTLRHDGVAFAVAHNHPGGSVEPSDADLEATRHLAAAAEQLGLRFLDHVIVTATGWRGLVSRLGSSR